ncbi:MAG: PAS domain-containing protein [Chloroflexi bacterium]|jgi:two-component system, NtrC family, sensor histidine kinase AtoS|nr:PAS domain-containing protein [Chloroflexota bacterium]MBT4003392.1 PAS domain-containing protein [Chloroflexota bacterium]MBT4305913.1 PAS domain-containing protein [Chloroflexota bacterium]MBT4533738.1 PAS domain-containing protein [Chloroflexota bacterium]MBT4681619.1 PAS domain-containing protein [Chloroflexota bacterium]
MKTSRLPDISKILKKTPGRNELEDIIEFLPQPTLLISSDFNSILLSNEIARIMVSYEIDELESLPLRSIFPFIEKKDIKNLVINNQTKNTTLVHHSGMQVKVNINLKPLGRQNQWPLLTFEKDDNLDKLESASDFNKQKWQAIQILSKIGLNPEKKSTESLLLQAGSLLTGAKYLGIYFPVPTQNKLVLQSSHGNEDFLPKTLNQFDIQHLANFHIWEKNIKISDSLEIPQGKSSFIASIPLLGKDPMKGILLIIDDQNDPPADIKDQLNLLVNTYVSYKSITTSIRNSVEIKTAPPSVNIGQKIENVISDGLILVTDKLEIINFNSIAEESLGYSNTEVIGQNLKDILIGMDTIITNIQEITLSESLINDFGNVRIRRRDGLSILLHIRAIPIVSEDKNILAILISDRSKQEEIQVESNRLKEQAMLGELTATFAHEVRNPINNISTSLQLMEIKFPDDEDIQKQIGRMKHDCERLTVLINKILSYSKTTEHKLIPINFKVFLEKLTDSWQNRLERENIESRLIIPNSLPKINADENALEQVFTNLIGNAARAMRDQANGVLVIKVEPLESKGITKQLNIDISDNGPGIPAEIQEKIFKPFFTTNNDGTGLGLAVSKRIISSHNGEISLKSFPGGTIFNIKLPTL